MSDRRYGAVRRLADAGFALALGVSALGAREGLCQQRVLPANAVQVPGLSTEGYPEIGRAQKVQIVKEVVGSSAQELVRSPLRSTAQVASRFGERMSVRVREILPHAGVIDRRVVDDSGVGGDPCDDRLGDPPLPARLTLLTSSEASIQALLKLIATARARIDLMMFGWENDPTGREVAEALAARARQGIQVRLLVDRGAYLIHNPAAAAGECTFLDMLRSTPNVFVIEPPNTFIRFDHRKLAVIDGRVAWTGGMILTEVARRKWRNLAFEAEGPIVASYACRFEDRWRAVGGCPGDLCPPGGPGPVVEPNATVRMVRTEIKARTLKDAIYHAVDHARHHIYLENPYFTDEVLTYKLVAARARGVDVRAILTLRGNNKSLNGYETFTANRLFRGGVRVYLYPIMTHVKAMSADGYWAYLGTGNFDELSLRNNNEVGLSVVSPALVRDLDRTVFCPDMADSEEMKALIPPPSHWLRLKLMSLWY